MHYTKNTNKNDPDLKQLFWTKELINLKSKYQKILTRLALQSRDMYRYMVLVASFR